MDWSVGVSGPDGKIYCVPDTATEVLCYDPRTRLTSRFGSDLIDVGTHKWSGGVLAGDGRIYCVPWTHPQVLVIDCGSASVFFLETSEGTGCTAASLSEHKWRDCLLAPDGCIYCVPWTAEAVLRIDVVGGRATCFGDLPPGESKWAGAALGSDGRIYCAPYDSPSVLCIVPGPAPTATLLGNLGPLRRKWRGAVAAKNLIYMIPYNALEVLVVEPSKVEMKPPEMAPEVLSSLGEAQATARAIARYGVDADDHEDEDPDVKDVAPDSSPSPGWPAGFYKLGWVGGIRCKWRSAVLAADGCIYGVPDCASEVLCIRPESQDLLLFGEVGTARWKWRGGVLAQDGKIYCAPYEAHEAVLVIDPAKLGTAAVKPFEDSQGCQLPGFVETSQGDVLAVSHS